MTRHALLDSLAHRDLRVRTRSSAALGDAVMACLVMPGEFRRAQAHYPIVFRRDLETGKFTALALFGFENGENLFLTDAGWDAAYMPLAQAVQPFLIGQGASGNPQVHVDLDSPRVAMGGDDGIRLFDEAGNPSPLLEQVSQDLGDLDEAYRASGVFFAALERHGLLEPFTLEVPLDDGSRHSLVGFHTIDEEKLRTLAGDALGELQAEGHLLPLFMAVASIGRFSDLIARKNARAAGG